MQCLLAPEFTEVNDKIGEYPHIYAFLAYTVCPELFWIFLGC